MFPLWFGIKLFGGEFGYHYYQYKLFDHPDLFMPITILILTVYSLVWAFLKNKIFFTVLIMIIIIGFGGIYLFSRKLDIRNNFSTSHDCIVTNDEGEERMVSCGSIRVLFKTLPSDETLNQFEKDIKKYNFELTSRSYREVDNKPEYTLRFKGSTENKLQKSKEAVAKNPLLEYVQYGTPWCLVDAGEVELPSGAVSFTERDGKQPVNCTTLRFDIDTLDEVTISNIERTVAQQGGRTYTHFYEFSDGSRTTMQILYDENTSLAEFGSFVQELNAITPNFDIKSNWWEGIGGGGAF